MIYNGSGNSYSDSSLNQGTTYYYQAWSWNNTDTVFSSSFASDSATTLSLIPLSAWSHRKSITINHSKVVTSHINFPILIQINNDADLAASAQIDFDDILFTDDTVSWSTGYSYQRLAHEIESYDKTNGNLTAWVNVTSL